MPILLRDIAHSRTGDKGNLITLSVIAYDVRDFPIIERFVTVEAVRERYQGIARGAVERYVLPQLGALNFVLHDALAGGVTRSLALDAHGKSLSSAILSLLIDLPSGLCVASKEPK
ncbi:MAG: hypothetical protein ACKVQK_28900 [Burkholderiales bacterium]